MMGEMVTISRAEYDRLIETAENFADLRAYDRAKAALAAGDDELIPEDAVRRILDGESPLRVFRELRGFTQAQLGELAGVNRVQIADIEAGRKSGSIDTVRKLASALNVAIDDLV